MVKGNLAAPQQRNTKKSSKIQNSIEFKLQFYRFNQWYERKKGTFNFYQL
jgi:hypothetical protein